MTDIDEFITSFFLLYFLIVFGSALANIFFIAFNAIIVIPIYLKYSLEIKNGAIAKIIPSEANNKKNTTVPYIVFFRNCIIDFAGLYLIKNFLIRSPNYL